MAPLRNRPRPLAALGPTVRARKNPPVSRVSSIMPLTENEKLVRVMARTGSTSRIADFGGSGFGMNTALSNEQDFFSPQLSKDFLELPQSLREKREVYRHFYNTHELVAQAIDLHTELPLSKIRLAAPRPRTCPVGFKSPDDYGKYILKFFERMCKRIKLFQRLITAVHHIWLDGTICILAEDSTVEVPDDVGYEAKSVTRSVLREDGTPVEQQDTEWVAKDDLEAEEAAYYQKHYKGWDRLVVLPIDQVKITTMGYSDKTRLELIPSNRDRALIEQAKQGDPAAEEMVAEIPEEVREHLDAGRYIPLGTDPEEGSFAYLLTARKHAGDELGQSILDRCHVGSVRVWANRSGVIKQIPIAELNPNTDQVLTGNRKWRDFEVGARFVSETLTVLSGPDQSWTIKVTQDHRHEVLRGDHLVTVPACEVQAGDYVAMASTEPSTGTAWQDLMAWTQDNVPGCLVVDPGSSESYFQFGVLDPGQLLAIRDQMVSEGYKITLETGYRVTVEGVAGSIGPDTWMTRCRKVLVFTDRVGYLVGLFMGGGVVTQQGAVLIPSPTSDREGPTPESHALLVLTDLQAPVVQIPNGLMLLDSALSRWLIQNFAPEGVRRVPEWVFETPKEFQEGILHGLVDSASGFVTGVRSTNVEFLDQVFLLFTGLRYPMVRTKPGVQIDQVQDSPVWQPTSGSVEMADLVATDRFQKASFLVRKRNPGPWDSLTTGILHREHNGALYTRVAAVSTTWYEGPVYSLNVHEDHTFFAEGLLTHNCLRTLYFLEKLRQTQTQIASRAMTPRRVVWADDISLQDVDALREQVDLALVDPDYSVVTNYEVHWEEMSSRDRLLDISTEVENGERRLRTGLGVTESLLSGESLYSGDRLKLEVINQRYLFLREILQEYVEDNLFAPIARRKGFVETDEWGDEVLLYPKLSFTRMPLRDSQDTFDALFNLYQKGSVDIDTILEMFNLDPVDVRAKLERDFFSVNDATFNEVLRGIYGGVGSELVTKTDVLKKIADYLKLSMVAEPEEESRF